MANYSGEIVFKKAVPPAEGGYPGLNPRTRRTDGMVIEYNVAVPMRDGVKIYIDVFRPDTPGQYPPLIAWGPYGKHGHVSYDAIGNTGVNDADFNEFTRFEAADPVYWCRNGYVIIYADMRGTWGSEGDATFHSPQEVEDVCDLIEWAGTQSWSNGKVGMHGVSYLSETQRKAAAANPPRLAAMNIWEGVSDYYHELFFHGGIPDSLFSLMWQESVQFSRTRVEDFVSMRKLHPLFDDYWASKNADLTKINVPAFIVASWTDHGLHLRGTVEGFKQILFGAQVASRTRPQEVVAFLSARERGEAKAVLQQIPKGNRDRQSRHGVAEGDLGDQGKVLRRRASDRERVADRSDAIHLLLSGCGERGPHHGPSER